MNFRLRATELAEKYRETHAARFSRVQPRELEFYPRAGVVFESTAIDVAIILEHFVQAAGESEKVNKLEAQIQTLEEALRVASDRLNVHLRVSTFGGGGSDPSASAEPKKEVKDSVQHVTVTCEQLNKGLSITVGGSPKSNELLDKLREGARKWGSARWGSAEEQRIARDLVYAFRELDNSLSANGPLPEAWKGRP